MLDAWDGYRRFVLGREAADDPMSRADAAALDRAVEAWRQTGLWEEDGDG